MSATEAPLAPYQLVSRIGCHLDRFAKQVKRAKRAAAVLGLLRVARRDGRLSGAAIVAVTSTPGDENGARSIVMPDRVQR